MKNILFVCTGNTCRSPMAEYIMNTFISQSGLGEYFVSSSAGVATMDGLTASTGSVNACREMGIDISSHRSRQLTEEIIKSSDIIITMGSSHKNMILTYFPKEAEGKTFTIAEVADFADENIHATDIMDPYMMDDSVYTAVCGQIASYLRIIINYLKGTIK